MNRATFLSLLGGSLFALNSREPAPRFKAKSLDGTVFTNESLKGKVALIQFWTTWCGVCRRDQSAVEVVTDDLRDKGLVVLAVNVGEARAKVERFLRTSPRSSHVILNQDTNLPAIFNVRTFPKYVVIDRDGRMAGEQNGAGGESSLRGMLAKAGLS